MAKPAPPTSSQELQRLVRWQIEWEGPPEDAESLRRACAAWLAERAPTARLREVDGRTALPWTELTFLALDTETTGLDRARDRIVELAWVRFERGQPTERFVQLLRVDVPLPQAIVDLTGIEDAMLVDQPRFAEVAPKMREAMTGVDFVLAYHAPFDRGFLRAELSRLGQELPDTPWLDPLVFIKEVDRYKPGKKLSDAAQRWGIEQGRAHRALDDALAAGALFCKIAPFLPVHTLADLLEQQTRFRSRQQADAATRRGERPGGAPSAQPPAPAPGQTRSHAYLFGTRAGESVAPPNARPRDAGPDHDATDGEGSGNER